MIMPAPFFPGPSQEYENDRPLKRQEFINALVELGNERYHSLHPFHKLLHNGKLSFPQVQAWALNRFYYQWSIPRKDLTLKNATRTITKNFLMQILYRDHLNSNIV